MIRGKSIYPVQESISDTNQYKTGLIGKDCFPIKNFLHAEIICLK